jgi:signal transduction histidine kinase
MKITDTRRWVLVAAVAFLLHATLSLALPEGFALTCCGDLLQSLMLVAIGVLATRNARQAEGQARAFWTLMAAGFSTWAVAQLMWSYIEVVQRRPVPDPFAGDIVLFFHVVPMMAALAVRPHRTIEGKNRLLSAIDLSLLMLWWLYLYVVVVIPPQYVDHDVAKYSTAFSLLYVAENLALLAALAVLWLRTKNAWRELYKHLLIASTIYVLASQAINAAIIKGKYQTGGVFDLPFVAGILWFLYAVAVRPERNAEPLPTKDAALDRGVVVSRMAMFAILSIPMIAAWSTFVSEGSRRVGMFRLAVSLEAIIVLAVLVFLKQYLLDRERTLLLWQSQENLQNLKRLHTQLMQSEKLAALGQLVSGAAHEINNPLTSILGYADLIATDSDVVEATREHALKIKQQTRRTKELVTNLLRFAKSTESEKTLVNLNVIVEQAVQLRALQSAPSKPLQIERDLEERLTWIWGDASELMEVCFQLIGNAQDAIQGVAGGKITIQTRHAAGWVELEVLDNGTGIADTKRVFDPFYSTKGIGKGTGLGLSACYGIVQSHQGEIWCENRTEGGARFVVRLRAADPATTVASASAITKATD